MDVLQQRDAQHAVEGMNTNLFACGTLSKSNAVWCGDDRGKSCRSSAFGSAAVQGKCFLSTTLLVICCGCEVRRVVGGSDAESIPRMEALALLSKDAAQ